MEKLINPTSIEASLKINEIINELENNSIADVTQGDLKNKIIVQKRNGSNSEITIDNVENAKKASRAIADDAGDIIRTSYLKKINGVIQGDLNISGNYKVNGNIFNEALNILKRNKRYALGDIVFDSRLKSYLHLKCVKGGTTDTSDLDTTFLNNVSIGNQFSDGEVTWEAAKFITDSDLKFSVTATDRADQIRVNNNGREEIITVNNVENALKVNNHTVEENVPRNAKFTDTTYTGATSNRDGLMSKEDKIKLDGIADGANKTVVDSALNSNSINPVQNKVITNALAGKSPSSHTHNYAGSSSPSGSANTALALTTNGGSAVQPVYFANGKPVACTYKLEKSVPSNAVFTDTTYGVASQTANGLLSASDKKKLDSISSNATHIVVDTSLNASSVNPVQNKAITNAINKCISKNPTVIPREADLNTILETGYYSCSANDTAKTIKNCPIQEAFYLEVVKNQESSNSSQIYTQFKQILTSFNINNPKTFIRTSVNHSGTITFGAWQEFVFSQNAIKSITANNNVLTYTTANARTQTVTIDNVPNATHAQSSGKLTTPRSISVGGGAIGTPVNFDGTQNITIPIDSISETSIKYSHKHLAGGVSPIDSAMSAIHSANRFQFANPSGITIEYSTDGGKTWLDYGADNDNKIRLVCDLGTNLYIGKRTSKNTVDDKLRITFNASKMNIYTKLSKMLLYINVNYSIGSNVIIERSLKGTPTVFTKYEDNPIRITGGSGWNSLSMDEMFFGGYDHQTSNYECIRLTFGITDVNSDLSKSSALTIYNILGFGETHWKIPSNMAKTGHIYTYDTVQNAIFPANVSAKLFDGLATKAQKDSREQVIDSTYIKGLSANGRTITVTKGDDTTSTITTQDTNDKVKNDLNQNTKAYITGTTSGSSNTGTQIFDSNVFLDAAPGVLCATTFIGNLEGHITNLKLRIVSPLTNLSSANNGWFKFTGTIDGVNGNWIIFKADTLYQATNIEDPRIVLNSNNLTTWYSPYAYWHA